MGAIIIAIPMVGTISLLLEKINMPKPRKNHKTGRLLCFVILDHLIYFIKYFIKRSILIVKLLKCFFNCTYDFFACL